MISVKTFPQHPRHRTDVKRVSRWYKEWRDAAYFIGQKRDDFPPDALSVLEYRLSPTHATYAVFEKV